MKTLLLLRHAKAEQGAGLDDCDRALTARGKADAAAIGRRIAALGPPALILTSPARRALETANLVAEAAGYPRGIELDPDLYLAADRTLLATIRELSDDLDRVLVVGHNPGISQLAGLLAAAGSPAPDLPTAGLVQLEFAVDRWAAVQPGGGQQRGVYTPARD